MSERINKLMRDLRDLPYEDMLKVSTALAEAAGGVYSPHHFADCLMKVRSKLADLQTEATVEERAIRDMVGSRRRGFTIKVGKQPKGWTAYIEEFSGVSVAQAADARTAISHALDQTVTAHLMTK